VTSRKATVVAILSLITHFSHVPSWRKAVTAITQVDPSWHRRTLLSKAWTLVRLSPRFDCVLFFFDTRLPVLFRALYCVRHLGGPRSKLVFTTWLHDVSQYGGAPRALLKPRAWRRLVRYLYYYVFVRLLDLIVVHSSAEVDLYARAFRVPASRFRFVPYCVRHDALTAGPEVQASLAIPMWSPPAAIATGRPSSQLLLAGA